MSAGPDFVKHKPSGHGWVWPNVDGSRARCGGPGICLECAADRAALQAGRMFAEAMQRHQYDEPFNVAAQMLELMKNQLLIVLVNRLGGRVEIPVSEVDATGAWMMGMNIDQERRLFTFETGKKS
jgi:hypothetical protein